MCALKVRVQWVLMSEARLCRKLLFSVVFTVSSIWQFLLCRMNDGIAYSYWSLLLLKNVLSAQKRWGAINIHLL
jgi:hypothetical protein